jgi:GTPase SAR1 family protein
VNLSPESRFVFTFICDMMSSFGSTILSLRSTLVLTLKLICEITFEADLNVLFVCTGFEESCESAISHRLGSSESMQSAFWTLYFPRMSLESYDSCSVLMNPVRTTVRLESW